MGWAAGAGEGWVHAWGEGIGGVAIEVYGYGYGYGGWRGRKEKRSDGWSDQFLCVLLLRRQDGWFCAKPDKRVCAATLSVVV